MKLQKLFETTTIDALKKAGIACSQQEFHEKFDLIIDFQDRMNALYNDLEEKLHIIRFDNDPDYEVPQIHSVIDFEGTQGHTGSAWFYLDQTDDDFELSKKNAKGYIKKAFARFLPELDAVFQTQSDDYIEFRLYWQDGTALNGVCVDFSAPEIEDSKHSNKHRKALKWW